MRRCLLLALCLSLASLAAAPAESKDATPPIPAPLRITEDDREVLLGFEAQRRLVLSPIEARQAQYLRRLAARLGITPDELGTKYRIDLDSLTLAPVPPATEASPK